MLREKIELFLMRLHEKSLQNELPWTETGAEGEYKLSVPGYTVRVREAGGEEPPGGEANAYLLKIHDAGGRMIERIGDRDINLGYKKTIEVFKQIHQSARRRAMGVNEALDELLKHL